MHLTLEHSQPCCSLSTNCSFCTDPASKDHSRDGISVTADHLTPNPSPHPLPEPPFLPWYPELQFSSTWLSTGIVNLLGPEHGLRMARFYSTQLSPELHCHLDSLTFGNLFGPIAAPTTYHGESVSKTTPISAGGLHSIPHFLLQPASRFYAGSLAIAAPLYTAPIVCSTPRPDPTPSCTACVCNYPKGKFGHGPCFPSNPDSSHCRCSS